MEQENKTLGGMYKSAFKDLETPGADYEWNGIEKRLDRLKFYRLSFTHFNIYYSLLILGCFIASITSATHYFLVTAPTVAKYNAIIKRDSVYSTTTRTYTIPDVRYPNPIKTEQAQQSTPTAPMPASVYKENNKLKAENNKPVNNNKLKNAANTSSSNINTSNNTKNKNEERFIIPLPKENITASKKTDSLVASTPVKSYKDTLKPLKETKTSRKTIYITKQDTIFEYDTLKTKKNKKFKK